MTTMVDSKIGRTFQRSVGRAKEKLLQNLGKVDRTADEILDEHIGNFSKQQGAATRLQKELNNYIRCIRSCAASSRSLLEAVGEIYEPEWGGKELLTVNAQSVELLWNDFAHRLAEQVLIPLNTYQGQFPEMRKKIEKRSRKLIDFDGERHALQALQANPRRNEVKLAKQRESLEAAKRTYDVLNSELHEELPSLYNSRIVFLVSAMSTLFASENIFHNETGKVFTELEGIVERLSKESAKGNLNFKLPSNAIMNHSGRADSPKDEKGGNTDAVASTSNSSNSKPSSPTSPSRPPSRNMASTSSSSMQNGGDKTLTSNANQNGDANHITESPTNESPADNALSQAKTNGIKENGIETQSTKEETAQTKMMNGSSSDGESAPVTKETKSETVEPGNVPMTTNENPMNTSMTTNDTGNNEDEKVVPIASTDVNNNDESMIKKPKNEPDMTKNNNTDKVSETSKKSERQNDIESGDGDAPPPPAPSSEPPTEGPTKPIRENQNGEVSEESPKKESSPPVGDSKEPGVLYRVRATYRYQKEDVDELSFEAGEIIRVIEYEDPEEQEEGWLMGIKENGERGLFPANFTRPI